VRDAITALSGLMRRVPKYVRERHPAIDNFWHWNNSDAGLDFPGFLWAAATIETPKLAAEISAELRPLDRKAD